MDVWRAPIHKVVESERAKRVSKTNTTKWSQSETSDGKDHEVRLSQEE